MSIFNNQRIRRLNGSKLSSLAGDTVYSETPETTNSFFGNTSSDFQYQSYQEELWQKCIDEALRSIEAANKSETQADRAENEADRAEAAANLTETIVGGQVTTFASLLDTPNTFAGAVHKQVVVNQFEDGLDYVDTVDYGAY